jgi:hypothetical protein
MTDRRPHLAANRREFVRVLTLGASTAVASVVPMASATADSETDIEKRKPRYQEHSPEVQTFYRVNRYPAK